jgi:dipeptidyl-peptidase-4
LPLKNPPSPAKSPDTPEDYSVDYHANYQTTLAVKRPYAYLLNRQEARAAGRLMMHGIQVHQLTKPTAFPVDRQRITKIQTLPGTVSGQRLTSLATKDAPSSETVPAGTFVIYADQPRSRLLTYLLEPRSDDGLTAWNFFRHALREGGLHPVSRITQAAELVTTELMTVPRTSQLSLDRIYGPKGRIPFGGSFPLSLRWLPKTSSYQWRQETDNYLVSAETGARTPVAKVDRTVPRKALKTLLGISDKEASAIANGPAEKSPDGTATLYRYQQDLVLYRNTDAVASRLTNDKQTKRLITFSPDSQYIAFIRNHNLIVVPATGGPEIAITSDGSSQQLYGYLDWVYQEELYGRGNFRGFWWSPDSLHIALLHLDETPVSRYTVADHLAYREKSNTDYYPKAGDPLPRVRLGIAGLDKKPPRWIPLGRFGDEKLISHVNWGPQGRQLYAQVQDRAQTWLELLRINAGQLQPHPVLRESTPAWVQSPGSPVFLKDGSFLWLSESTGYRHIQHVTNRRRRRIRVITSGPWEVQKILGVDQDQQFVYFLGNRESGREAHAYRVPLVGGTVQRLTTEPGNHAVRFNDTFTHFLDYVSGIHRPISVYLHRADGTRLRTLAPNLVDHLDYYALNKPEFVTLAARDGHPLTGILIKPPDFEPGKRYPVLCHVYGGPQAPVARNRWAGSTYLWHQYLAQQGYVIWIPDNRASTHEGVKGAWPIHLNMGRVELRDLEDGIKWLTAKKCVDPERVGIWGWSYGGYLTSYALTHSKLFKVGIAGAPVTDWRNYDAIYTERYMGIPSKNPKGYLAASPVHAAKDLHGRLLLIHGSLDDNVHLSNTLQFAHALQNAGKQFQLMIYPNNKHGITRSQQSRHLRDLMTQFILDHL